MQAFTARAVKAGASSLADSRVCPVLFVSPAASSSYYVVLLSGKPLHTFPEALDSIVLLSGKPLHTFPEAH